MRKTALASVLVFALCSTAFAGDIPMPPIPEPPPATNDGGANMVAGETPNAETDSLTETLLSVIESVTALF